MLLRDRKAKAVCQTYWTYKSMSSFLKKAMPSLDVTGIMMDREMIAGGCVVQALHVVTVLLRTPHPARSCLGSVLDSGATLVESVAAVGMPV